MELKPQFPARPVPPPQTPYAQVEVLGGVVLALVNGMDVVKARALRMLAERGISPLRPDGWYPMSAFLDSLQSIFEQIGPSTVRAIGRKLPDSAQLPAGIDSLERALRSLDTAYRLNHRGSGPIGGYRYEPQERRGGRLVSDTPYPCELDMGLLEAFADRYRPHDALWVRIDHETGSCRRRDDLACTYHLSW